jgi:ABC-2 type transport system permease protein
MSGAVSRIAREEWRALARNRAGVIASVLLVLLVLAAALVSFERHAAIESERARYQASVDHQFDEQPARHPHRMVHYGQFVFRPLSPLAFFDFGVDGYTGNTIFLEGHRQNSANFAEARQSSLLLRFGQLTPAFVLQTLAPLLLIFLAFASVSRERERGTLRLLLSQGIGGGQLLLGKLIGHAGIALAIGAPAFALLIGLAASGGAAWSASLLLILGYAGWLLLWATLAVLVSALVRRSRDALIVLVGVWMIGVILLPRALPEVAATRTTLPTRIETEVALHRDLKQIGDSHDPEDPYFNDFKARTLAHYGVTRVEDLPVQYAGLVGMEGERLSTDLYARAAKRTAALEAGQGGFVQAFSAVSPLLAIRQLSMAVSGSDMGAHQHFLDAAEAFRYRFVQVLNRMQVDKIPNTNAGEDPRIGAENWATVPRFSYAAPAPPGIGDARVLSNVAVLGGWLLALALLAVPIARRLGRAAR